MNKQMNQFRVAAREVFNNFFRVDDPYNNGGWDLLELFFPVEKSLFRSLVIAQTEADDIEYGYKNESIIVVPVSSIRTPIMINREISSGYWDHPVEFAPPDARFSFIRYFDWDQLSYSDNRYVKVEIRTWPDSKDLIGRQALIESQYVNYARA